MNISSADLARVRKTVGRLLDTLGLDAYLYELEPGDDVTQLRVECAVSVGWESCAWSVSTEDLLACDEDAILRERLLQVWSDKLGACKRSR